mgnify:FL=1
MKLEQQERDFMRLVLRSPDTGDGWRNVAKVLVPVCEKEVAKRPELYEFNPSAAPARIRLTERGNTIVEYV